MELTKSLVDFKDRKKSVGALIPDVRNIPLVTEVNGHPVNQKGPTLIQGQYGMLAVTSDALFQYKPFSNEEWFLGKSEQFYCEGYNAECVLTFVFQYDGRVTNEID